MHTIKPRSTSPQQSSAGGKSHRYGLGPHIIDYIPDCLRILLSNTIGFGGSPRILSFSSSIAFSEINQTTDPATSANPTAMQPPMNGLSVASANGNPGGKTNKNRTIINHIRRFSHLPDFFSSIHYPPSFHKTKDGGSLSSPSDVLVSLIVSIHSISNLLFCDKPFSPQSFRSHHPTTRLQVEHA